LAFAFVLLGIGIRVNAVAITTNPDRAGKGDTGSHYVTNQATLTVTGVQAGDGFKAYKLLDAFYNDSTNVITYEFTDSFKNYLISTTEYASYTVDEYFALTSGDITSGSTTTTSSLDKMISGYVSYIKANSVVGTDMTVSGTTASATLDAGAYFVKPENTTKIYAVMVGNLDFDANGSDWNLNNESIVAKVTDASLTKTVSGLNGKDLTNSEFTYTVVGTVPQYPTNATNKVYKIEDTISNGITFSPVNTIVVKDGSINLNVASDGTVTNEDGNTVATIAINGQKMTVTFDVTYVTSTTVSVVYKAKFNDNVVLGEAGNKNSAALTYSNDPYGTGTYTTDPTNPDGGDEGGEVVTKVYGIELFNYELNKRDVVLSGSQFELYADSEMTEKVATVTTDEDGITRFKAVAEGTYYLKQVKVSTGYQLVKDSVPVKVNVEGAVAAETNGYFRVEVPNPRMGALPFTGGTGLLFYSLIGILIIGIGMYTIIKNQKKITEEKIKDLTIKKKVNALQ